MPETSPNYQLMRPLRHRNFGHPNLIEYLTDLASRSQAAGLGELLIGDMGQPRGGPALSGHASHQTGLDVDLWYWRPEKGRILTLDERNNLSAQSMVVPYFRRLTKNWRPDIITLLQLAAQSQNVDRIFVNPIIKQQVCQAHPGEDWVGKLRPWYGHDDHFHVRLKCPKENGQCRSLADPVPVGDGCGMTELGSWLTEKKRAHARYLASHPSPFKMPELPPSCEALLKP